MKPYVAQDVAGQLGWYGDCLGVSQNADRQRTQAEALQWCLDRLWAKCEAGPTVFFRGESMTEIRTGDGIVLTRAHIEDIVEDARFWLTPGEMTTRIAPTIGTALQDVITFGTILLGLTDFPPKKGVGE